MAFTIEIVVAILLVLILGVVIFFEWRYLRSRREAKVDAGLIQDDAYNAIATAKSISESLRNQGRDVKESEALIRQAEDAYSRRNYLDACNIAGRAKSTLKFSKPTDDILYCAAPTSKEEAVADEECVPVLQAVKKLPTNYLESKFLLESTKQRAEGAGSPDIDEINEDLCIAQSHFDRKEYDEALKYAMRAKKLLEHGRKENTVMITTATPSQETRNVNTCQKCSTELGESDIFCPGCGSRQGRAVCSSCSSEAQEGDKFCRKCGTKIDS